MRIKSLAFAISTALFMVNSASAAQPFQKETEAYKQFVIEQIDHLEADTQKAINKNHPQPLIPWLNSKNAQIMAASDGN